jgi:transcriptional regulator with XRE-family HTH domain
MTFSAALREAMAAKSLTVLGLSRLTGIHDTTLSQYRTGKRIPDVARADALAELLDTPELRRAAMTMYRKRCVRCRKRFFVDPRNINHRIYCGPSCRTMGQRERARPKARQKQQRRIGVLEKAVAAHCRWCQPDGICRDSECALRSVSPFPIIVQLTRRAA